MTLESTLAATSHSVPGVHICPLHLHTLLVLFDENNLAFKLILVTRTGWEESPHTDDWNRVSWHYLILHPLLVLTAN